MFCLKDVGENMLTNYGKYNEANTVRYMQLAIDKIDLYIQTVGASYLNFEI